MTVGSTVEMDCVASAVIGGTFLTGGRANILGTMIGVFIMQTITIMVNSGDIADERGLTANEEEIGGGFMKNRCFTSFVRNVPAATYFAFIGKGHIGPVPFPIVLMLAFTVAFSFVINHTPLGRHFLATGGSAESARMMGIRVERVQITSQVLCSICVGIAGVIMTSRLGSVTPLQGEEYETKAITAAVLGGSSLAGGTGNVVGTVVGALILSLISNIFNLQGDVPAAWQKIVSGGLLILSIVLAQCDVFRAALNHCFGKKSENGAEALHE